MFDVAFVNFTAMCGVALILGIQYLKDVRVQSLGGGRSRLLITGVFTVLISG